jgi:hypothetical protein
VRDVVESSARSVFRNVVESFVRFAFKEKEQVIVPIWIVLAEGHRPYVTTTAPSEGYYASMKRQGHRVYRAEVAIPEKVDDGLVPMADDARRVL